MVYGTGVTAITQGVLIAIGFAIVGLPSPIVWVDVETVNNFDWVGTTEEHAAVVQGTVRGYRDQGLRIGFYSLPSMWSKIVGDLGFGAPEWRPAGENPQSSDVSGVHVNKRRRQTIYYAGLTSGLGGAFMVFVNVGSFDETTLATIGAGERVQLTSRRRR